MIHLHTRGLPRLPTAVPVETKRSRSPPSHKEPPKKQQQQGEFVGNGMMLVSARPTALRAVAGPRARSARTAISLSANHLLGTTGAGRREGEEEEVRANRQRYSLVTRREFHSTPKSQSVVALTMLGIAGAAFGGSILLDTLAKKKAEQAASAAAAGPEAEKKADAPGSSGFTNLFSGFLGAKTFYQGGFEPQMTKREAALILGVRESAPREKIREAHRTMSRLNHPDTGGSEYLAMKINEAKDLLLGSK